VVETLNPANPEESSYTVEFLINEFVPHVAEVHTHLDIDTIFIITKDHVHS